jgi:tetratricopeptide (TPR) repeat protein
MIRIGKKFFFDFADYEDHFLEVDPRDLITPQIKELISSLPVDESGDFTIKGNESFNKNNFHDAIDQYSKAIEHRSQNISAILFRGISYINIEKYRDAANDFSNLIAIKPQFTEAYFFRANAFLLQQTYESLNSAIDDYTKFIDQYPNNGYSYYLRGSAYYLLLKLKEAKLDWEKSKSLGIDFKEKIK